MDKETFNNKVNEVEVPKEEVLQSIKLGVNKAVQESTPKKKNPIKRAFVSVAVAAGLLISSSFIFPSFSKVMADAPVIGGWYAGFNDMVGRNLEEQHLVQELNQTYSSKDVDVTLTSAYYDGYLIGITFDVEGKIKKSHDGNYYALYELFHGDPLADETKELTTLEKTEDGYKGHIQIVYPYKDLPKHSTIPVSFEEIGEKQGNWQFNVPVQQNPVEIVTFDQKVSTDPEGNVEFKVDSVVLGKASTAIVYRVTYPKGELDNSFRMLEVNADIDLPQGGTSDGKIDEIIDGDQTTIVRRLVFPKLIRNTTLTVSPSYDETYSPVEPIEIDIP